MIRSASATAAALLALGLVAPPAELEGRQAAEPTRLVVHVVSHDAKVIGTGVGGARVTVRELESGRVLATGVQEGGTGSTPRIIQTPRERGAQVYEGAASYTAELALTAPTRVEVVAEGPLGTAHATQRASKTLLIVPGMHVEGDGLVLELHGFTVEILAPVVAGTDGPAAQGGEAPVTAAPGAPLEVRARVTMLCGCPTQPGGTWDADRIEITARLLRDGRVVAEAPLPYAGETSTYAGSVVPPGPGSYRLEVLAADRVQPNAGLASLDLVVGSGAPR